MSNRIQVGDRSKTRLARREVEGYLSLWVSGGMSGCVGGKVGG
jgi:hypothetical protein